MTHSEIIVEAIKEAIIKVEEAKGLVDEVLGDTNLESHYEGYGKYGFDELLGDGNRYDFSLYDLIKEIEDEEAEFGS